MGRHFHLESPFPGGRNGLVLTDANDARDAFLRDVGAAVMSGAELLAGGEAWYDDPPLYATVRFPVRPDSDGVTIALHPCTAEHD